MQAIFGRSLVVVFGLVSVLAACSSSTSDSTPDPGANNSPTNGVDKNGKPEPDDASTREDSPTADPLSCLSHTWCGSGSVTQWNGQVLPTARGGVITDGLYRQAYILAEKGTGTTFGDYGAGLQFRKGSIRTFGGLSKVGAFTVADGKLAVSYTSSCDDGSGATGTASTAKEDIDYLVDANGQLFVFYASSGSAGNQTVAHVYLPQASFCGNLPKAVPTAPGDSFVCKVQNCGCTEATNGPANAQTCKFVHGG